MDISTYEQLTGLVVSATDEAKILAQIDRTQSILEGLLGFSIDPTIASENQYVETGKTKTDCPCDTPDDLDPADQVISAYRLFPYNKDDHYLVIDPATVINAVKLVRNGVTFKTIDDFRANYKNGYIKYLEQIKCWCTCNDYCDQVQLAVDASWLGSDIDYNEIPLPNDLLRVWADMVNFYSDPKNNIKSETLGTHSYTKFTNDPPEMLLVNISTIKKYAGPNGSIYKTITI